MKKHLTVFYILLSLLGIIAAIGIFILGFTALKKAQSTQEHVEQTLEQAEAQKESLQAQEKQMKKEQKTEEQKQIAAEAAKKAAEEKAKGESAVDDEDTSNKPSVFNNSGSTDENVSTTSNGHVVCIDPGHQGEWVDMSATEPNGPGSSVPKTKCSTGTSGSYTGLNEYQLNLDVSLKLQQILIDRGYQVVMTRTDNDTAISNAERALFASDNGAEIMVRVHANGDDSHTASGALTMSPSSGNPYVADLYDESNRLSQCIIDSYCAATGFNNRGIIYTDDMTGINWSKIPVTIVEMGFMTHETDDRQMADPAFQETMAAGIADGIDAYFGLAQ